MCVQHKKIASASGNLRLLTEASPLGSDRGHRPPVPRYKDIYKRITDVFNILLGFKLVKECKWPRIVYAWGILWPGPKYIWMVYCGLQG